MPAMKSYRPEDLPEPGKKAHRAEEVQGAITVKQDSEVPIDPVTGIVYHLACAAKDIADRFIFVGDPGRVPVVAERFDKGSIIFSGMHREIAVITGTYNGVPVTVLSTGMGTDNCEIILNEIHVLKEYDLKSATWTTTRPNIRIIRVGTSGSPNPDVELTALAVSRHSIGMDNTCKYYKMPEGFHPASVADLEKRANATALGAVGVYATKASEEVTAALAAAYEKNAAVKGRRSMAIGTTASGSGFYGCQGRTVGRFKGLLTVPNLVDELATIRLPVKEAEGKKVLGGKAEERVVNIEMENSAICFLSRILGYKAGTVCCVVAKRAGDHKSFAEKDAMASGVIDAVTVGLDALISIE
jgi:uridine phosphorylase